MYLPASVFQSTLPHGERPVSSVTVYPYNSDMFQSTLPHGERLISRIPFALSSSNAGFNPRSRTGSDLEPDPVPIGLSNTGFQSTLPHGERRLVAYHVFMDSVSSRFNPRSRTGSDGSRIYEIPLANQVKPVSITRSRTGSDRIGEVD